MEQVNWTDFITASIAVILSPGPGSLFVAQHAALYGFRSGSAAMLGVMLGDLGLIICSFVGASALLRAHPSCFHGAQFVAAAYLVYLGIQAFRSPPGCASSGDSHHEMRVSMRHAFFLTLMNPHALVFFMAFFPLFIRPAASGLLCEYAGMAAVFMLLSAVYLGTLAIIVALAGRNLLNHPKGLFRLNQGCGIVFVVLGLKMAWNASL